VILFESLFEPLFADSSGDVGRYGSLAMDEEGFAYVAYYDETHATSSSPASRTRWRPRRRVDSAGDVGGYTSMVSGLFIPGPYMWPNRLLRLHEPRPQAGDAVGASWVIEIIDSTGDVGRGSSVHWSPMNITSSTTTPPTATSSTRGKPGRVGEGDVDSDGERLRQFPSIAFSSSGVPYISYYAPPPTAISSFATKPGNQWQKSTVDSSGDVGRSSSIALKDEPLPEHP